jgi:hypothetical protein
MTALKPLGFFVAFQAPAELLFVRPNNSAGLFESVDLSAGHYRGGISGEISGAGVSISLTPGKFTSPKGMVEYECLLDESSNKQGWSKTQNPHQAAEWEKRIVRMVPRALAVLSEEKSPSLLARTADTRAAVERYLALIDRSSPVADLIVQIADGATDEELRESKRLSRTEGFICLPERHWYDFLALLITRLGPEVEGKLRPFWGISPWDCPELNWRFQLLASRLYPEPGWELFKPTCDASLAKS